MLEIIEQANFIYQLRVSEVELGVSLALKHAFTKE